MKNNYNYRILNFYNLVTYEYPNHNKKENNKVYIIEKDICITFNLANIMEFKGNGSSIIYIKECFEYIQKTDIIVNFIVVIVKK